MNMVEVITMEQWDENFDELLWRAIEGPELEKCWFWRSVGLRVE